MTRVRLKRVFRGWLTGSGETITAAKADLAEKIDAALDGTYDPLLITFGTYTIVLWRTPSGYEYKLMSGMERVQDGVTRVSAGSILGTMDRDEAIQSAAHHVVSVGGIDYHDDSEIPSFVTSRARRSDLLYCCRFQRAYRWAKEHKPEGRNSDSAWHEWACGHANEPQFS